MTTVISRAEAKRQGLPRYFTGKPCKHGHISERATHNGLCLECKREQARESYAADPEKKIASVDRWRRSNLRKKQVINAQWAAAQRCEAKEELTPHQQWQVAQIYKLCNTLTLQTGIVFNVDHYIPVCKGGRQVPENLWVIPAEQNRKKGAKLPGVAKLA